MFRSILAALLLSVMATDTFAESVQVGATYPPSMGLYSQLIATSNSFLAQNGGVVMVGTGNSLLPSQQVGWLMANRPNVYGTIGVNYTPLMEIGPADGTEYYNSIGLRKDASGSQDLQIVGVAGYNDYWKIYGDAFGIDNGQMHIQTGDNGNEYIIFEQYNVWGGTHQTMRIGDNPNSQIWGNGYVGFGSSTLTTVPLPGAQVDVNGVNSSAVSATGATQPYQVAFKATAAGGPAAIFVGAGGTAVNIGIGTVNPLATVDVSGEGIIVSRVSYGANCHTVTYTPGNGISTCVTAIDPTTGNPFNCANCYATMMSGFITDRWEMGNDGATACNANTGIIGTVGDCTANLYNSGSFLCCTCSNLPGGVCPNLP